MCEAPACHCCNALIPLHVSLRVAVRALQVGRAFQATKHAVRSLSTDDDSSSSSTGPQSSPTALQLRDAKYDRYKKFDIDLNDYYTLLGLDDKMFDATKEEITEAYRTICKVSREYTQRTDLRALLFSLRYGMQTSLRAAHLSPSFPFRFPCVCWTR